MKATGPASLHGQSSLLLVMLMAGAIGVFGMLSAGSLTNRLHEKTPALRRTSLLEQSQRLTQVLRSPDYINGVLMADNPQLVVAIRSALSNANAQIDLDNLVLVKPDGHSWFGRNSLTDANSFEPCANEKCQLVSTVSAHISADQGAGYARIVVSFKKSANAKSDFVFNADNPQNKIVASFPINLMGVELRNQTVSCKAGYKTLLLALHPMEFLCATEP